MIYHKMIAANPLTPKKINKGIHTIKKIKLILLSFQDKLLNLRENMGISDTNSHEKGMTNSRIYTGWQLSDTRKSWAP